MVAWFDAFLALALVFFFLLLAIPYHIIAMLILLIGTIIPI